MSDTPLTEKHLVVTPWGQRCNYVSGNFARQQERENIMLKALVSELADTAQEYADNLGTYDQSKRGEYYREMIQRAREVLK